MTYDGNGNPTTYGGATMAYDVENRVTSVGTGSTLTNGYRSDGLRAWKQGSTGGKTYFLYDGGNPIVELDSSGNVANVNVFAPDGLVARKEGSTWTNYTFDQQGSVVHKLDSSQTITAGRLLDAWGTGVETTLPRNIDPYGYNAKWGYYYDRETGLYLCQHRMYDASAGRWLNRDPIGYSGGVNLYGYCGGGPVGSADPSGLSVKRQDGGAEADIMSGGDPTWDEVAAHGFMTSWAMLGSFLSNAGASMANDALKAPLGILGPFVNGPFRGWNGGEYANAPGAAESRTSWSVAATALSIKGVCELVPILRAASAARAAGPNASIVPHPHSDWLPPGYTPLRGGRQFRGPTLSPDPSHPTKGPHWDWWPPGVRPKAGDPQKRQLYPGDEGWPP